MKNSSRVLLIAGIGFLFAANHLHAQQQMSPIPIDKNVRIGKLDNGLTYYIRHNEYPKNQINFHIAQKVGSIQEDDNQRGLAHFLEHMCFNGTKNFPEKKIITWLESIGVKFGHNLNAHTSVDRTVYDITNVPATRESVTDSCLLILHDWADGLTLSSEEIDKERGVIHEEWRSQTNAFVRIIDKEGDAFYPNCKYGKRMPIGTMEVIDNFPHQLLRDYYEKWYRPDLQGIIVVGDIDVDKMEQKIKNTFSSIQMPANPAKFEYVQVSDNDAPILVVRKDKEMPYTMAWTMFKYDVVPREKKGVEGYLITSYLEQMVGTMLNKRFTEISLNPNSPFGNCAAFMEAYLISNTKEALNLQAMANDKGVVTALKAALIEAKRVKDFGFTVTEYDRARTELISQWEQAFNNRAKENNNTYAAAYIANFIDNEPISGTEYMFEKMKQFSEGLTVEMVNEYAKSLITDKNMVILATCPDKEGMTLPSKEELQKVIDEVKITPLEAYKDNVVSEPLMSQLPASGKIVSTTENKELGYTELILSNGAKVLLKPTQLKDNEIVMKAVSKGGASLYPASDYPSVAMISSVWEANGLGKFNYVDLKKVLLGKQVSVSAFVSDYAEGLQGNSTIKDLETMMQLIYMNFTEPRHDKTGFESIKQLMVSQLQNMSQDPQYVFQDSVQQAVYAHHPKAMIMGMPMLERMDYDRMVQIYKERFANAADFTFIFCGNFEMEPMSQLVAQYIASLPANGEKEEPVDNGKNIVKGVLSKEFVHETESNQAMMAMIWSGKMPYTLENRLKISIVGQLMSNELLNRVREDEGAAYSPYAECQLQKTYDELFVVQTQFGLNPDKREKSEKLTIACLEDLAQNVPEAELNKMKEFMIKQTDQNFQENGYWLFTLEDWAMNKLDMATKFKETLQTITTKDMQDFIAGLLKQGNRFEVLMMPEK